MAVVATAVVRISSRAQGSRRLDESVPPRSAPFSFSEYFVRDQLQTLRNFIDGESVDTGSGATSRSSTRRPASRTPRPAVRPRGRRRRHAGGRPGVRDWRDATPSERQLALLRIADDLEKHAEEVVAVESRNTGKPIGSP